MSHNSPLDPNYPYTTDNNNDSDMLYTRNQAHHHHPSSEELYADHHGVGGGNDYDFAPSAAFGGSVPTRLHNLTKAVTPTIRLNNQKRCSLPPGYVPGDKDVICGRGKKNWGHSGNVHFRNVIRWNVQRYIDAPTKNDKTLVVIGLVDEIRAQGGRFLKEDLYGRWFDIGDAQARDKVGHSLRDQVSALNRQQRAKRGGEMGLGAGILARARGVSGGTGRGGGSSSLEDFEEELSREDRSMDLDDVLGAEDEVGADPALAPAPERRNSIQSDTGNEVLDARRSSLFSSFLVHSFTRRPSFLAFSFGSRTSARHRASSLMGGDLNASKTLDHLRRSSNWEFLDSFDDMLENMEIDGGGEYENDEPLAWAAHSSSLRLSANAARALLSGQPQQQPLPSPPQPKPHPYQSVFDEGDIQLKAEI